MKMATSYCYFWDESPAARPESKWSRRQYFQAGVESESLNIYRLLGPVHNCLVPSKDRTLWSDKGKFVRRRTNKKAVMSLKGH